MSFFLFPVTMYWLLFLGLLTTPAFCKDYLLPGDVVPHHYDVVITYDIDPATNFSYFGVVDILVSIFLLNIS